MSKIFQNQNVRVSESHLYHSFTHFTFCINRKYFAHLWYQEDKQRTNVNVFLVEPTSAIVRISICLTQGFHLIGYFAFVLISVLRFLSVKYPFKEISTFGVNVSIMCCGILALTYFWVNFYVYKYIYIKRYLIYCFWVPWYSTSITLLVIVNTVSYRTLKARKLENVGKEGTQRPVNIRNGYEVVVVDKSQGNKMRAVKTLIYITVSYVLSNFPFALFAIIHEQCCPDIKFKNTVGDLFFFLLMANTGINALIYTFRTKELKQFYKDKIT